jgi:hypothetical protein
MPAADAQPTNVIPVPEQYAQIPPYDLLLAAARGHVGVDNRLLRGLLDDPEAKLPGIVRFALENRSGDRVDLSLDLMRIFCAHPVPEAVPFFISEIRRFPDDVPDEISEALVRIGAPALDPLLELYRELGEDDRFEVPFLLAALGIADPRIEAILEEVSGEDSDEGEFLREIYEDSPGSNPGAHPYDIFDEYPESSEPPMELLPEKERIEFLTSPHAAHRSLAAKSWVDEELSDKVASLLLETAQSDPEEEVRGMCWEALADRVKTRRFGDLMRARLRDPAAGPREKIGLATALLDAEPDPAVDKTILAAYDHPPTRARALRAMVRSFNPGYAPHMLAHLEDTDVEQRRQAILGVGMLGIHSETPRLEKYFHDPDVRSDALMAYALAVPAETSRYEMRRLYERLERMAGGFSEEDESAVKAGIDLRLRMHGKATLFVADVPEDHRDEPAATSKIGRNDPCSCGSGKKYKKCCGA